MIIYKTTNLVNGKFYIGKDKANHNWYLGSGKILKNAIRKYGKENFKKEILETCQTKEELDDREIFWINFFNATNNDIAYNLAPGGQGGDTTSFQELNKKQEIIKKRKETTLKRFGGQWPNKGVKFSLETRSRMSEAKKGGVPWIKGRKHSEETKKLISKNGSNKIRSTETKEKMKIAAKKRWENMSEEYKIFLSNSKKGKMVNRKPCCINGINYVSVSDAMQKLNIGTSKFYKLLNDNLLNTTK